MATSKEIEIILQAKLDQGNAVDSAKSLGTNIAEAISNAFDGLGEKIASKLMLEMRGVLSNVKFAELFSSNNDYAQGLSQKANQGPIVNQYGQPYTSQNNPIYVGAPGTQAPGSPSGFSQDQSVLPPPPVPSAPSSMNEARRAAQASDARVSASFGGSSDWRMFSGLSHGLGFADKAFEGIRNPITNLINSKAEPSARFEQALEMDATAAHFRAFNSLRKIDPSQTLSPELRERVSEVREFSKERAFENTQVIVELNKSINELKLEIERNSDKVNQANQKEDKDRTPEEKKNILDQENRKALLESNIQAASNLQNQNTKIANFAAAVDGFENEERMLRGSKFSKAATGVALGSELLSLGFRAASEIPLINARSAAGDARERNFGITDLTSNNLEGMIATQMLGGEENLRGDARLMAYSGALSRVFGGLGTLGLAAASTNIPAIGTAAGLTLGTAGLGQLYSGYEQFQNIGQSTFEKMKELQANKIAENQPLMTATRSAYELSKGTYQNAQAMGAEEFSDFLLSSKQFKSAMTPEAELEARKQGFLAKETERYNKRINADQTGIRKLTERSPEEKWEDYSESQKKLIEDNTKFLPENLRKSVSLSDIEDATGKFPNSDLERLKYLKDIAQQNTQKDSGIDLRRTAASFGISGSLFNQTQAQIAASLGGYFPTIDPNASPNERFPLASGQMQDSLEQLYKIKAGGFSNIQDVMGAFFNQTISGASGLEDRTNAAQSAISLHDELIRSGVDKMAIPSIAGEMAGRMNSLGFGSANSVLYDTRRAFDVSRSLTTRPDGTIEGKDFDFVKNIQANTKGQAMDSSYFAVASNLNLIDTLKAKNKNFNQIDTSDPFLQNLLFNKEGTADAFAEAYKRYGKKDVSEDTLKQFYENFEDFREVSRMETEARAAEAINDDKSINFLKLSQMQNPQATMDAQLKAADAMEAMYNNAKGGFDRRAKERQKQGEEFQKQLDKRITPWELSQEKYEGPLAPRSSQMYDENGQLNIDLGLGAPNQITGNVSGQIPELITRPYDSPTAPAGKPAVTEEAKTEALNLSAGMGNLGGAVDALKTNFDSLNKAFGENSFFKFLGAMGMGAAESPNPSAAKSATPK